MKTLFCALMLACSLTALVAADPGWQEQELSAVKGKILVPEGWHVNQQEQDEEGVIVYQITREDVPPGSDTYVAGLTLSVTTKVPERAELTPSKYASELLVSAEDTNPPVVTKDGPFNKFRLEYAIEGQDGNIQIVDVAYANDGTGTLYFIAWQSPQIECEALDPIREKVLSSVVFDPSF